VRQAVDPGEQTFAFGCGGPQFQDQGTQEIAGGVSKGVVVGHPDSLT